VIGVVIVAHGGLAPEYLSAVEHVVGTQSGLKAISIEPDHDRDQKKAEIRAAVDSVDTGSGVVVVTDMFGGSPSNLSLPACGNNENRKILLMAMIERNLRICNEKGLHARASAKLVEVVEQYDATALILKDGLDASGDSIMGLLMLAASKGTTIEVQTDGKDAEGLADAIEALVNDRFGEDC